MVLTISRVAGKKERKAPGHHGKHENRKPTNLTKAKLAEAQAAATPPSPLQQSTISVSTKEAVLKKPQGQSKKKKIESKALVKVASDGKSSS